MNLRKGLMREAFLNLLVGLVSVNSKDLIQSTEPNRSSHQQHTSDNDEPYAQGRTAVEK